MDLIIKYDKDKDISEDKDKDKDKDIDIDKDFNYYNILKTKNEDKNIEFFWYSYKSLIKQYLLNNKDIRTIIQLSELLNNLQKEKKYLNIIILITQHLNNTDLEYKYNLLKTKNMHTIHLLYKKIYKWEFIANINLSEKFKNSIFYIFLCILNKCYDKQNVNLKYKEIINIIQNIDFSNINNNIKDIENIIVISLTNHFSLIIDMLKKLDNFNDICLKLSDFMLDKPYFPKQYPGKRLCLFYRTYNKLNKIQ